MKWLTEQPIAHRGLHNENRPENSIPAFEAAMDAGFPLELDVQLLADGTPVVFHDETLERMTGEKGSIHEHTIETIKKLRLKGTEYGIPLLDDILDLVRGAVPVLLEIKNILKVGPIESAVYNTIKEYVGDIAVQSFNPYTLEWFKNHAPHILRGQLSCDLRDAHLLPFHHRFMLSRLMFNRKSEPNFIGYNIHDLPHWWVTRQLRKRDIPLIAWTVRNNDEQHKAERFADNYIFENIHG